MLRCTSFTRYVFNECTYVPQPSNGVTTKLPASSQSIAKVTKTSLRTECWNY